MVKNMFHPHSICIDIYYDTNIDITDTEVPWQRRCCALGLKLWAG